MRGEYKKADKVVAKWEYNAQKALGKEDYLGYALNVPSVTNIAIPAATGFGVGLAFRGIGYGVGLASSKLAAGGHQVAAKAVDWSFKGGSAAMVGVYGGTVTADIGNTYLDSGATKAGEKALGHTMQFTSFMAGAKAVSYTHLTLPTN